MIEFKNVSKHFGPTQVLHNIDLNIRQGEVVVIIGPSGSGKSTLLRCINKLEEITSGDLIVDGLKVNDPKVDERLIRQEAGMVFQQFYLFPHLTALENVMFGPLRVRGVKKEEAEKQAKALLAKVGLAERSLAFFSLFIRAFALVWHWLASAYFIVLFFFSLFDPGNSLKFMMGATVRSLAIIGIAAFISGMFTRWIAKTITLSPHTQRNYPELQKRLNGWLSSALKVARVLTVCVAVMLLLNAWGLFDFWHWLHYGAGEKMVDILIRIALILFFSAVGWTILASLIENRLASDIHGRPLPSARTRTLLTLFRNALAVIISTITIMIVLSEIGVNIAPLLAGAGALGLAISFGSQTLVKDIITGVFIQFENGMNTGDLVTIGPLTGTVERMSIRSVGVRQDTGAYHIIPWSSITTFANFVRGIGSVVANYDVDRHEDADKANQALKDAVTALMQTEDIRGLIIGEPTFAGIVGLTNTAFTLRVSFTTLPLKQWTVRFALDSQVKKHFDLANVRAPVQTYQVLPAPVGGPSPDSLPPREPTI
ncbi:mechanosensitive channel protein [Salmonella enterica]|nr:mechanosensitive channel protein [Salmonella enterica]EEE0469453.1 mechanosensitive channel protein [Salmonella enterica]